MFVRTHLQSRQGFSLVEILLAMAIMGVLAISSIPVFRTMLAENDLTLTQMLLSQAARQAQAEARAEAGGTDWGVYAARGRAVVFAGDDYVARDTSKDTVLALPPSIDIPATSIVFFRLTALPNQAASLTLTAANGSTRAWTVSAQGVVN